MRREGEREEGGGEGGGRERGRREEERRRNGWRELGMHEAFLLQSGEGGSERGEKMMSCVRMKGASGVNLTYHSPITVPQTRGSWEVF